METLGQAEPYFVKCIRSNAEKVKTYYLNYLCSAPICNKTPWISIFMLMPCTKKKGKLEVEIKYLCLALAICHGSRYYSLIEQCKPVFWGVMNIATAAGRVQVLIADHSTTASVFRNTEHVAVFRVVWSGAVPWCTILISVEFKTLMRRFTLPQSTAAGLEFEQ